MSAFTAQAMANQSHQALEHLSKHSDRPDSCACIESSGCDEQIPPSLGTLLNASHSHEPVGCTCTHPKQQVTLSESWQSCGQLFPLTGMGSSETAVINVQHSPMRCNLHQIIRGLYFAAPYGLLASSTQGLVDFQGLDHQAPGHRPLHVSAKVDRTPCDASVNAASFSTAVSKKFVGRMGLKDTQRSRCTFSTALGTHAKL